MKDYLVCVDTSYTNGKNGYIEFKLKAEDIDSAIETANQALDIVKSLYSFVKNFNVKNVSEIAENVSEITE